MKTDTADTPQGDIYATIINMSKSDGGSVYIPCVLGDELSSELYGQFFPPVITRSN